MNVPETGVQIMWCDWHPLYPEKMCYAINLVWSEIRLKQPPGDIFWLKSLDIGQKINGFIDFFDLFMTLPVHRITNT